MEAAMLGIGSRMPVTPEERELPLHCKKVPKMNVEKLVTDHPELRDVARAISDPTLFETVRVNEPSQSPISLDDVTQYVRAGYCASFAREEIKSWGKAFTVVENKKGRRRFIMWPKDVNETLKDYKLDAACLPSVQSMHEFILKFEAAEVVDLDQAFCQIPLAPQIQPFFGFMVGEESFVMTVLPMGFTKAVDVI